MRQTTQIYCSSLRCESILECWIIHRKESTKGYKYKSSCSIFRYLWFIIYLIHTESWTTNFKIGKTYKNIFRAFISRVIFKNRICDFPSGIFHWNCITNSKVKTKITTLDNKFLLIRSLKNRENWILVWSIIFEFDIIKLKISFCCKVKYSSSRNCFIIIVFIKWNLNWTLTFS